MTQTVIGDSLPLPNLACLWVIYAETNTQQNISPSPNSGSFTLPDNSRCHGYLSPSLKVLFVPVLPVSTVPPGDNHMAATPTPYLQKQGLNTTKPSKISGIPVVPLWRRTCIPIQDTLVPIEQKRGESHLSITSPHKFTEGLGPHAQYPHAQGICNPSGPIPRPLLPAVGRSIIRGPYPPLLNQTLYLGRVARYPRGLVEHGGNL